MGDCAICGRYSCECCATPPTSVLSVKHPSGCFCYLCYRAKKEAEATPCPATPQANPAETETATGRIAGREEAEQAPASFEFDAEKYIAAAEALEAGDKPDPVIADLIRRAGKQKRALAAYVRSSREIWTEYMKGCGNTDTAGLPPWRCAECTEAMLTAMDKAMTREADDMDVTDKAARDRKEVERLRGALWYIVTRGYTGASYVAKDALQGSDRYTQDSALEGMGRKGPEQ